MRWNAGVGKIGLVCVVSVWLLAANANDFDISIDNLRLALQEGCTSIRPSVPVLIEYQTEIVGSSGGGGRQPRNWNKEVSGRIYKDDTRADLTWNIWNVSDDRKVYSDYRHAFWDGERGFNYQADGPQEAPTIRFGVLRHSNDYLHNLTATTRCGGFMDGPAYFGDVAADEMVTWSQFAEQSLSDWRIETSHEGDHALAIINFARGDWHYQIFMESAEGTYMLSKIIGEQRTAETGQGARSLTYTFIPLEYTDIDGLRIISKAQIQEDALYANGEFHRNSITTTRTSIQLNPDIAGLGLFEIDAPDGTIVDDRNFPEMQYVVHDGQLVPFSSNPAAIKGEENIATCQTGTTACATVENHNPCATAAHNPEARQRPEVVPTGNSRPYWLMGAAGVLLATALVLASRGMRHKAS